MWWMMTLATLAGPPALPTWDLEAREEVVDGRVRSAARSRREYHVAVEGVS
jgi:hypothetical protein